MPGRHQIAPTRRFGLRWILGAGTAVATFGAALGIGLLSGGASANASTPTPTYHPGSDTATFTVLGVVDGNCRISTGGTEIWIKPGDKIDFASALVGVNIESLPLTALMGKVAGLNVSATIDPGTSHAQAIGVTGGKTTTFPTGSQTALSAGDHKITWTATGVPVLPGLVPGVTLPLTSSELESGASLSWTGVIHVTNDAPQCKLSVGTPKVGISVGPVKATVPPVNVSVPTTLPAIPGLPGLPGLPGGKSTQPGGGGGSNPGGSNLGNGSGPVQAGVVPVGDNANVYPGAGAGGFNALPLPNILNSNGGTSGLLPVPAKSAAKPATSKQDSAGKDKTIDLASKTSETGQLSVILAIIAVIALTLVAATYARLYVLRKN
jgi:hypothetical protein